jgi:hypothetical protein
VYLLDVKQGVMYRTLPDPRAHVGQVGALAFAPTEPRLLLGVCSGAR